MSHDTFYSSSVLHAVEANKSICFRGMNYYVLEASADELQAVQCRQVHASFVLVFLFSGTMLQLQLLFERVKTVHR